MSILQEFFHLLIHPVDGFEEMKYRKSGSPAVASIVVFLWFILSAVERQYTSFRFNAYDIDNLNIVYVFISTVVLFVFFCLANWSLCTLFDGEGTLREIWICAGYAMAPFVLSTALTTLLSVFMSIEEAALRSFITAGGLLWTAALLILGMVQIHAYTLKKTLLSLLGSFIGIILLIFLSFLLILLFQQIFSFLSSVFEEILLRLK